MAAVNPTSLSSHVSGPPRHFGGVDQYKEISPVAVSKDKELRGTDKFGPASYPHYLPVWDNEKGQM